MFQLKRNNSTWLYRCQVIGVCGIFPRRGSLRGGHGAIPVEADTRGPSPEARGGWGSGLRTRNLTRWRRRRARPALVGSVPSHAAGSPLAAPPTGNHLTTSVEGLSSQGPRTVPSVLRLKTISGAPYSVLAGASVGHESTCSCVPTSCPVTSRTATALSENDLSTTLGVLSSQGRGDPFGGD